MAAPSLRNGTHLSSVIASIVLSLRLTAHRAGPRDQAQGGSRLEGGAERHASAEGKRADIQGNCGREGCSAGASKPLGPERWAGGIDTVGSTTLANVLSMTRYGGVIAACGLAGRMDLPATVAPFILRGVSLIGIDSVMCPLERRREAWKRLASDIDAGKLATMTSEIDLAGVMDAGRRIVEGAVRGRIVVKIAE
jgi:NADPH:quinone reductase-like Zn-dependent oxidoreductase